MNKHGTTVIEVVIVIFIFTIIAALIMGAIEQKNDPPIMEIDGCEYIVLGYGDGRSVTHKGNCSNPIHYKTPNVE